MTRRRVATLAGCVAATGVVGLGAGSDDREAQRSVMAVAVTERPLAELAPTAPPPPPRPRDPHRTEAGRMPEIMPQRPGPVPIPRARPASPGPVPMPEVHPDDPRTDLLVPLPGPGDGQ